MTTIGIITYHNTINYGGLLQAYALQKSLRDMACRPEIIDFRRGANPEHSRFHRTRHYVWDRWIKKLLVGTGRQKKTDQFLRNHFSLSNRNYRGADPLHNDPPDYDAYITGSDQVWNPILNSNDSSFFLTFAPPGKLRIAYAPSFGVSRIPERFTSAYREWLKKIDYLSCRETVGTELVKQLTGRDAPVVLDPTLLLGREEWHRIAVPFNASKPYILCYYMPGDRIVERMIARIAKKISQETGLGIIAIGQKEYMRLHPGVRKIFDAGPAEFIGLLENASFVVTNSFHGTAFSINFEKPFLVPVRPRQSSKRELSSRITSMMKFFELEDRIVHDSDVLSHQKRIDGDYIRVRPVLENERKQSLNFLKSALEAVTS